MTQDLIRRLERASTHEPELDLQFAAATGYRNAFTGQLLAEALADPETADEARRWEGPIGLTDDVSRVLALVRRLVGSRHSGWTYNCRAIFDSTRHGPYINFEITWPSTESQGRGSSLARAACAALLRAIERDPAMLVPGAGAPAIRAGRAE